MSNYAEVRNAIAVTSPEIFANFNECMWTHGGFERPIKARQRVWNTKSGRANSIVPRSLAEDIDTDPARRDILQLVTPRSDEQFNTTVYGYYDRFRGIKGTRKVVFMHCNDIDRLGLHDGGHVDLTTEAGDDIVRRIRGFRVMTYDIPEGCVGGYYPECNPLLPLWHYAERSKVPAAKSIPVSTRTAM